MGKSSKLRAALPCLAVILLTACGGGGGGGSAGSPPGVTTYAVGASAGTGGGISPSSVMVNAGATTTFTVTPNSGHVVASVTGCDGTMSGNTYTTGAINANCTVTASFTPVFTWVSGSNSSDANGIYGTQGTAAAGNTPGARHGAVTWTDAAGNLWLFGGFGVGDPIFDDLWRYSPSSGEWTWVGGSSAVDVAGVYGTQGVAAAANMPGSLGAFSWTDAGGNLWMFGGYGYASGATRGWLNALWKYSPANGMWTWVGGSNTVNAIGVYGTRGVAAVTNQPGARATGGWTDANGNVWVFGGYGYDSAGALGDLNDLWEYSPSSGEWTWVGGPGTVNARGVYGIQGTAAAANLPGARFGSPMVVDNSGNVWLFGGYGYDSAGNLGYLNDLWEYSPAAGMWTWMGGSNVIDASGVYGTRGIAAATNVPGARLGGVTWADAGGNLWLLGGSGYDSAGTLGELNDLWEYSPSTGEARWVSGSSVANASGVYGTQGVAATTNMPSGRDDVAKWMDASGDIWLFGGEGFNPTGADPGVPEWNDLWKYPSQ